jgi:Skp family chaperone for outer membrane proteins
MIEDKNYVEEEVAEDLLDLIKEYEAEIKKLNEREKALLKSLQASLGDSPTAQIDEYVRVKIDRALRLFELDLRTRYADEEAAASKAVDRIFKEYA